MMVDAPGALAGSKSEEHTNACVFGCFFLSLQRPVLAACMLTHASAVTGALHLNGQWLDRSWRIQLTAFKERLCATSWSLQGAHDAANGLDNLVNKLNSPPQSTTVPVQKKHGPAESTVPRPSANPCTAEPLRSYVNPGAGPHELF
eukprot:1155746-Pelagomonas_calceolata.AAC.4